MPQTDFWEFEKEGPPATGESSGTFHPAPDSSAVTLNEVGKSVHLAEIRKVEGNVSGTRHLSHIRERELMTLLENSPDIIVRYDQNFRRIYANRTYVEQTVFTGREALVISMLDKNLLPESIALQFQQMLANVFETGRPDEKDFEWIDQQNAFHCFSIRTIPEFDYEGRVESVISIARDVTDKRKSDKLLAKREQEYRILVENSSECIVRYNLDCKIVYANPYLLAQLNCSEDRLLGKSPLELFPDYVLAKGRKEIENYVQVLNEVLTLGEKKELEIHIVLSEDKFYLFRVLVIPEKDTIGNITGLITFGRNITEYRKTENNLKEAQNRLSAIISAIPDLVWLKDKNGVYLNCNKAFEDFFGASQTEIVGKTDYGFVVKEVADFFRKKDQEAIAVGKVCITEEPITYAVDGRQGTLETRKVPLYNTNGEIAGVLGIARDITERKLSEKLFEQREQAYRSLAENAPENIIRYDLDGKAIYRNHQPEALPKPGLDESQMENYNNTLRYVLSTGEKRELEIHSVLPDGSLNSQSVIFTPERDSEGNIIGALAFGRDITERKKIEEANLRLASDLKATLQAIPDMLFEVDAKGTYLNVWAKNQDQLLLPADSIIGHRVRDLLPSHAAKEAYGAILEAKRNGTSYGRTYYLDYPDGRRWFEISVSRKPSIRSSDERFLSLVRDITDRINAEKALRESEEKFSSAFRFSPTAFSIIRLKENIVIDANESFCKLMGYDREELIGRNASDLKILSDSGKFVESMRTLNRNGNIRNVEIEFLHRNGYTKCGLVSAVRISVGGESCILLQVIDITKRKRTEKKLLNEQFKLSEAQRIGHIGSWEYNFETSQIRFSNEINKIYEIDPERTTSTYEKFLTFVHPEDRDYIKEALKTSIIQKNPCIIEHRIVFPDGRFKHVFQHSETFYNVKGEPQRIIGTIQDITFKKMVELELREAKEKAEESNRLKSAFLATMNHELRTPLNHIIGFSDLIINHPEKTGDFVEVIKASGQKLLDIIEDIFQLAVAEQSEVVVRNDTFNLGNMFSDSSQVLFEILGLSGKQDRIELKFSPDEELLNRNVIGDLNKINQVLGNLFKNAVKFTEKGFIEFGMSEKKPGTVTFFVRDTGIGIQKDKHPVIFEFFRQGDDSNTRKHGGVGVGLAISKRITEVLKGKLTFVSETTEGSTFYFSIPVEDGA